MLDPKRPLASAVPDSVFTMFYEKSLVSLLPVVAICEYYADQTLIKTDKDFNLFYRQMVEQDNKGFLKYSQASASRGSTDIPTLNSVMQEYLVPMMKNCEALKCLDKVKITFIEADQMKEGDVYLAVYWGIHRHVHNMGDSKHKYGVNILNFTDQRIMGVRPSKLKAVDLSLYMHFLEFGLMESTG